MNLRIRKMIAAN